jgi:hypothetical protein
MESEKVQPVSALMSDAWHQAVEKHVLLYQLLTNLAAVIVFSVIAAIAGVMLGSASAIGKVFGFVLGLVALGAGGLIMASGAAAIMQRTFYPPASSYDSPWRSLLIFFKRNCSALSSGYGVHLAVFVGIVCILLIPATAAWSTLGRILYAILLIPMALVAACGVLFFVIGATVLPAEVALRQRGLRQTLSGILGRGVQRFWHLLRSLGLAYIAAVLVASPILLLINASVGLMLMLVRFVTYTNPAEGGVWILAGYFLLLLIAIALTLPMAFFNVIVGLRYRELVQAEEADVVIAVET